MYPEVQVVRGGDQGIDQLHAGNLWSRQNNENKTKSREKLRRNYRLNILPKKKCHHQICNSTLRCMFSLSSVTVI